MSRLILKYIINIIIKEKESTVFVYQFRNYYMFILFDNRKFLKAEIDQKPTYSFGYYELRKK